MKSFSEVNEMSTAEDVISGLSFYVRLMESDYDIVDWKPVSGGRRYDFEIRFPDGHKEWVTDTYAAGILYNNV